MMTEEESAALARALREIDAEAEDFEKAVGAWMRALARALSRDGRPHVIAAVIWRRSNSSPNYGELIPINQTRRQAVAQVEAVAQTERLLQSLRKKRAGKGE